LSAIYVDFKVSALLPRSLLFLFHLKILRILTPKLLPSSGRLHFFLQPLFGGIK
jgi:hypothetical protein